MLNPTTTLQCFPAFFHLKLFHGKFELESDNMPALNGVSGLGEKGTHFIASEMDIPTEVDHLVSRISHTLQLKAKQKLRKRHIKDRRKTSQPYDLPSESCDCGSNVDSCLHKVQTKELSSSGRLRPVPSKCRRSVQYHSQYPSDPHQLLKYLLREGTLVKEAVERLKAKQLHSSKVADDDQDPRCR